MSTDEQSKEIDSLKEKIKYLQRELSTSSNTRENFLIALSSCVITVSSSGIVVGDRNTYQLFGKIIKGTPITSHFKEPQAASYFASFKKTRIAMDEYAENAQGEWKPVFDSAESGTGFLTWNSFPDSLGWEIKSNKAHSVSVNEKVGHYLVSDRELIGPDDDCLITYKAAARTEPQDLSLIIGGRQAMDLKQGPMMLPEDYGYCFGFGSHRNSLSVLQRKRRLIRHSEFVPKKGERYDCIAERVGGKDAFLC